jgi:hypothetical protein
MAAMSDAEKPKSRRGGARPNTGGARPGAGRPATQRGTQLSLYISAEIAPDAEDIIAALDTAAKEDRTSRAAIVVKALRKFLKIKSPV